MLQNIYAWRFVSFEFVVVVVVVLLKYYTSCCCLFVFTSDRTSHALKFTAAVVSRSARVGLSALCNTYLTQL